MKATNLAEAIRLFVAHLLDAATDLHVVLGPVVWRPSRDNPADKNWYFILATCGVDGFRCHQVSTGHDQGLADEARALTIMALIERAPLVAHDTDDERHMARLCETLWPSPRTRALARAVERERAKTVGRSRRGKDRP